MIKLRGGSIQKRPHQSLLRFFVLFVVSKIYFDFVKSINCISAVQVHHNKSYSLFFSISATHQILHENYFHENDFVVLFFLVFVAAKNGP